MRDYYEILGVDRGCDDGALKAAFRKLAMEHHPDRNGGCEEASGRFKEPIAVAIEGAKDFYVAEDYHQNYYQTNALKYQYYRWGCGRDARLKEVWGEPSS